MQSEAARSLAVCMEALEENAGTNTGVRKMFATITRLREKLGVNVQESSKQTQSSPANELNSEFRRFYQSLKAYFSPQIQS